MSYPPLGKVACTICGKFRKQATARMEEGKTCSPLCSSIKGYLSGDRKETEIELRLQELVRSLGLDFEIQKPLCGVTVADVFIPPNIALFADGAYWHRDTKHEDEQKSKELRKYGIEVLRLGEEEILKGQVEEKVKKAWRRRSASFRLI